MHTLYVRLHMCKLTLGNTGSASGKIQGKRKWFELGCAVNSGNRRRILKGGILGGERRGEEQEEIESEQVHSG